VANQLKMDEIQQIQALRQLGWSQRRIAEALGVNRETVARYLARGDTESKPAKAPLGSTEDAESKPAKASLGSTEDAESKPAKAPLGSMSQEASCCGQGAREPIPPEKKGEWTTAQADAVAATDQVPSSPRSEVSEAGERSGGVVAGGPTCSPPQEMELAREASAEPDGRPARAEGGALASACPIVPAATLGLSLEEEAESSDTGMSAQSSDIGMSPNSSSRSTCGPLRALITAKLDQGLSAQRIYQDLVTEHGFRGSYYSVRRFVRRLGQTHPLPFRRLECAPGHEVQVDFGKGAPVVGPDGKRRRSHVFRLVLSHSRKAYSEVVYRQTSEEFIRCLENAFWYFGGVPETVVLDNLKAAVTTADWYDPELNPKLLAFATHYGVVLLPTKSYTPRHKGKIERGIGYVQDNALKGRTFASLDVQNEYLRHWEATVADTRVHGTTRQQAGKVFAEVERACLRSLPLERFPFFHEGRRSVHRDGHVEVAKAYYSVPPEYLGRHVWVRWDARLVRIFNHRLEEIALHVRREPGRFSTHAQHLADAKISGVERGATYLLTQVSRIGPQAARWSQAMLQQRGIEGVRVLQGLLSLAKRHASADLERACATALSYGAYRLRTLRTLLQRQAPQPQQLTWIEEHPLIRPLSDYAALVQQSLHKEFMP
jgi:transposase